VNFIKSTKSFFQKKIKQTSIVNQIPLTFSIAEGIIEKGSPLGAGG
jgi:hypothetical protein